MSDLRTAIQMAAELHHGQVDKSGQPYILHPLRVMLSLSGEVDQIVGVLHDVVEDCECDLTDLAMAGFAPEVTYAVGALTRRKHEPYEAFIERAKANPISRRVKIADIKDNLRPGAAHLREKYERALAELEETV
ncbi:HD domain-containing protein [Rhizobium leucaenae]|uniref:HD domain-containing protein n=1 Tax=Rhizobium leucaenae TaxID=29450 RepID=UPI001609EE49|nr:HD domain-containing protein [Rhizobium leucaenae]MBB6299879.1 (p)ppGpp synthase/HD superfamily hydrolase [Rhizobium leucaenae]